MWFRQKQSGVKRRPQTLKPKTEAKFSISWLLLAKPLIFFAFALFAYLVYANGAKWLQMLDKTPIQAYAITNKPRFTSNADLREVLAKEPMLKGYFGQDITTLEEKLLTIPWLKAVIVRKMWPDKLSLTLFEHQPVAVWNNNQFLSEQGVVFTLPGDRFDKTGLPILYGPDLEGKNVLNAWNKISADLRARNLALKAVEVDNRGSWSIVLTNGIELRLGRGEWAPKIDRFVAVFPHITAPEGQRLSYVDLRYEHGAAVGFSPN